MHNGVRAVATVKHNMPALHTKYSSRATYKKWDGATPTAAAPHFSHGAARRANLHQAAIPGAPALDLWRPRARERGAKARELRAREPGEPGSRAPGLPAPGLDSCATVLWERNQSMHPMASRVPNPVEHAEKPERLGVGGEWVGLLRFAALDRAKSQLTNQRGGK